MSNDRISYRREDLDALLTSQTPARPPQTPQADRYQRADLDNLLAADEGDGWLATGLRVASGFAPGGPIGMLAGGAGEFAAQKAEGKGYRVAPILGQAALGAIPFKAAAKGAYQGLRNLLRGSGTGALMSVGSEGFEQISEGDLDLDRLGTAAGMGGVLGAGGGAVAHMLTRNKSGTPFIVERNDGTSVPIRPSGETVTPDLPPVVPEQYRRAYPQDSSTVSMARRSPRVKRANPADLTNAESTERHYRRSDLDTLLADLPTVDPTKIGGAEHAESVMQRIRASRGQVKYPRGADPAVMIGRSADTSPTAGLGRHTAADVLDVPDGPVRRPSDPDIDVDAPLSADELARAAEPMPPPARPSPAARRRARRQKLEAAIREAGGGGTKPKYTAEQVAEHRRAAGYEDLAPDDVPSLEQAARRFPSLPESDLRTLLEKYAFERTQIETPQRPKLGFDDFVRHERKVLAKEARVPELDDRFDVLTDPYSERGAISDDLLFDIASYGGGIGLGTLAGTAFSEDDRIGATGGALAGLLLAMRLRHPAAFRKLQYGGMLGGPTTQLKGIAGSGGGAALTALEKGVLPDFVRELADPETLRAAGRGFKEGSVPGKYRSSTGRAGSPWNPITWPGRAMGAYDAAGRSALERAGISAEDAADQLLIGDPKSEFGRKMLDIQRSGGEGGIGEDLLPFVRTGINAVERGIEAIPGVGFHPSIRGMRNLSPADSAKKQALGALAIILGLKSGEQAAEHEDGSWGRKLWGIAPIAMGPYAALAGLSHVGSQQAHDDDSTTRSIWDTVVRSAQQILPAPEVPTPAEYLARPIPRDLSELTTGTAASEFDTRGNDLLQMLARIPGLNSYLLKRKAQNGRTTTSATRSRTDRRARRESRSRER